MERSTTAPNTVTPLRPRDSAKQPRAAGHGIEVQESQMGLIKAQLVYRMRCECGRAWFDIQLPKLAECPSCAKKGVVFL
ncbi:MAG: hypothetical protein ABI859_15650 [Pseudomonadota bacterium]